MRFVTRSLVFGFAVSAFSASALFLPFLQAQEPGEALRGPDGGTRYHVAGIELLSVAGKPFTAKDSIEWTIKLEDGSTVATHLIASMARDSQGRIYRERRNFVPANSNQEPVLTEFVLYDPGARTRTACVIATRQCTITQYHPLTRFEVQPPGPFAGGTRTLERQDLGTNVIDDLNVTGTRETTTIGAGVLGNEKPMATTREFWYSPDLETNLAVTREDPREGTQYIHLIDLSRAEPDPAIFEVPAGYVTRDLRHPAAATSR
jgi:hypothetical protein